MSQVLVYPEPTSSPNAYKFSLNCPVVKNGAQSYSTVGEAQSSPIATSVFAVGGIEAVHLIGSSVTVIKKSEADWEKILPDVERAILESAKSQS